MPIRAVLFDFGGVLYNTPDLAWVQRWERILRVPGGRISALMTAPEESEYVTRVFLGEVKESEVWDMAAARLRIAPGWMLKLRRAALSKKRLNRPLADFLAGLRPAYRTGILSNAGSDARVTFVEGYGLDRLVDEIIISAEVGLIKPDERIYALAAERMGFLPAEILFVDDLPVNVEAAARFGMAAVQHVENAATLAAVQALLDERGH